jgi:hypothetical protein
MRDRNDGVELANWRCYSDGQQKIKGKAFAMKAATEVLWQSKWTNESEVYWIFYETTKFLSLGMNESTKMLF